MADAAQAVTEIFPCVLHRIEGKVGFLWYPMEVALYVLHCHDPTRIPCFYSFQRKNCCVILGLAYFSGVTRFDTAVRRHYWDVHPGATKWTVGVPPLGWLFLVQLQASTLEDR